MKNWKRIISLIIAVIMIITAFSGCVKETVETTNDAYITKGVFFDMAIDLLTLYPISCNEEDLENDTTYKSSAQVIVDWGLLPEEIAMDSLDSKVTKDIVVTVCINNMYFTKTGSFEEIKDIDKCCDPQAIADAVATGLIELENGWFDAEQKMTYEECEALIIKANEIDANSHFDSQGDTYVDTSNYTVIEPDEIDPDLITFVESDSLVQAQPLTTKGDVAIQPLGYCNTDLNFQNVEDSTNTLVTFELPTFAYQRAADKIAVGKKIFYSSEKDAIFERPGNIRYEYVQKEKEVKNVVGEVKKIDNYGAFVRITVDSSPEQVAESVKNVKTTNTVKFNKELLDKILSKINSNKTIDIGGNKYTLSCNVTDGGNAFTISAKASVNLIDEKYTNPKSTWRNAQKTFNITYSSTISDVLVDTNNIGGFLINIDKNNTPYVKVDYNQTDSIKLDTEGLRLTPDTNGNSGFASAFSRSQWRNSSSKGAKAIKILSNVPLLTASGVGVYLDIFMVVNIDGSVTFETSTSNSFTISKEENGNIKFSKTSKDLSESAEAEINLNLTFKFLGRFGAGSTGSMSNWVDGSMNLNFNAIAAGRVWQNNEVSDDNSGFTGKKDLQNTIKSVAGKAEIHSCFYGTLYMNVYAEFLTSDCWLTKKNFTKTQRFDLIVNKQLYSFHLDDFELVSECSFGEKNEDEVEYGSSELSIADYSITLLPGGSGTINVTGVPMSKNKLNQSYRGLRAKSYDNSIATVKISDDGQTVNIVGMNPGTAQGVVYINKKVGDNKFDYKITFTIIVAETNGDNTTENCSIVFDKPILESECWAC